ncbi:hypothetical protein GQ596_09110, partial [Gilliamella sp. Pra-s60]|uniref:hypothetical protein n=2 Tax=unclassified Gilliamella TaxID=2685620 RepID=UPI00132B5996
GNRQPATGNRQPATGNRAALEALFLNLIQSVDSQKQTPFLFLSPKSFRIAISTALSVTSSDKLSSIFKLLSKSSLFFAPLVLLSYTQGTQALTASTTNTIEGSAPYLTFDGGQTKITDTENLLFITLPDGTKFTPSTNTSVTNPIKLPNAGSKLDDITIIIPPTQSSIDINDFVTQGYWGDDDGDGQTTATGKISVTFTDKIGNTVGRSDALDICKAPYKVTLTSTSGTLTTQYGLPRSRIFNGATVDYYINPYDNIGLCSVRPNLLFGGTNYARDDPRYAGPVNIWNPDKGFLVQSTTPSSYGLNFPTTGSDGLYFDLDIGGIDASQLSWTVNTVGSLSATVSWTRPRTDSHRDPWRGTTIQHDNWITDKSKNVTRVTLHGPKADSTQISSSNPSSLARPSLPQTFELVGRDSSGNELRYGFVLRQWFVNRGYKYDHTPNHITWCNSLGYRLSQVRDLTNAVCSGWQSDSNCRGAVGATPSSSNNVYMRHIGAGFFTEWGRMDNYADAGFVYDYYWTSDVIDSNFRVHSSDGFVNNDTTIRFYAVCTF